jgi:hypothetical protein
MGLMLISLFSRLDQTLLSISANTLCSYKYQGDDALRFINIKTIQAVVTMISHRLEIEGHPPSERFFLVEKLGLDVAIIASVEEDVPRDEEDVPRDEEGDTPCV